MSSQRYPALFTLDIGAYGGSGHGRTYSICISCFCAAPDPDAQHSEIAAAHAAAKARYPELDPATYCTEYEDRTLPPEVCAMWREVGVDMGDGWMYPYMFAELCAAFLNLGNPDLKAKISMSPVRSIQEIFGMVGYGVFE